LDIDYQKLNEIELEILKSKDRVAHQEWLSVARTHKGHIRMLNEDAYFENAGQGLWAVADGMGGHSRGDRASRAVVEQLEHFQRKTSLVESIRNIENCLIKANEYCQTAFPRKKIGSTVAIIFAFYDYCFFLWAGDSRVYRRRDGQLEQMTKDHSLAQERLNKGEICEKEAETHRTAHILTRAIGVHRDVRIQFDYFKIQSEDQYLICTDGLYMELSAEKIKDVLENTALNLSVETLVDLVLKSKAKDNITALIVQP